MPVVEIRWELYRHEPLRFAYQNASFESTRRLSRAWANEDGMKRMRRIGELAGLLAGCLAGLDWLDVYIISHHIISYHITSYLIIGVSVWVVQEDNKGSLIRS